MSDETASAVADPQGGAPTASSDASDTSPAESNATIDATDGADESEGSPDADATRPDNVGAEALPDEGGSAEDLSPVAFNLDPIIGFRDEDGQKSFETIRGLPGFDKFLETQKRAWDNERGNHIQRYEAVPKNASKVLNDLMALARQENPDPAALTLTEEVLDPLKDLFMQDVLEAVKDDPSVTGGPTGTEFYKEFAPFLKGTGSLVDTLRAYGQYREELGRTSGYDSGSAETREILERKAKLGGQVKDLTTVRKNTPPAPSKNSRPAKAPDLTTVPGILASNLSPEEKRARIDQVGGY